MEIGREPVALAPTVAFVGTNRRHKGLEQLREAISNLQDLGFHLVVTDDPPTNALPWEEWVGTTSFGAGLSLVASADIVVIPSLETPFSRGQLPAKLIDAMMMGRAVVASDLPAIRWAVDAAAELFVAGSSEDLERALRHVWNPELRRLLGRRARQRSLELFSVDANVDAFAAVIDSAMTLTEGEGG